MTDDELKQSVTDFLAIGDAPTEAYRSLLEAATLRTRMNPRLLDNAAWDIPAGTPSRGDIARARLARWARDGWSEPQAPLEELRIARRHAEAAKMDAFEALRVRERLIASRFKDPYGRDTRAYERARKVDEECVSLLAAFNAARDAFHVAARSFREVVKENAS